MEPDSILYSRRSGILEAELREIELGLANSLRLLPRRSARQLGQIPMQMYLITR